MIHDLPQASVQIAVDMVKEGLITEKEGTCARTPGGLQQGLARRQTAVYRVSLCLTL
jgi:hypothetical protein